MARKKNTADIPQLIIDNLKKQVADHYGTDSWEEYLIEQGEDERDSWLEDLWFMPMSADEFAVGELYVIPYCTLVDGGEPIATYNLEIVKHIEYQQAEIKVYKRTNAAEPGYVVYSGDDANEPTLFRCE